MTDYQNELVMEHLDLVNWVIRTRISVPNRPLLTYDDFYAIGCEAICRAALKYQADSGEFAPFACRYIYNAIIDHCRAMNYRLQRSVDAGFEEGEVLFDLLAHTTVDFEAEVTDDSAKAALRACKEKYCDVNLHTAYEELCKIFGPDGSEPVHKYNRKSRPIETVELPIASAEVRDNTYSNLLSLLTLCPTHQSALKERGLKSEEMERLCYRTTPTTRLKRIVTELLERGCILDGVPGFYCQKDSGQWVLDIRGSGIMLPDRNLLGQIEAIQVRLDKVYNQKFYNLTSVDQYYGTQSKCCPHYVGVHEGDEVVCLTEGVMKSDLAYSFAQGSPYECGFVGLTGIPSYSQYERALEELDSIGVKRINVMVDSDYQVKEEVRKARDRYIEMGAAAGFEMAPITWTQKQKGVDDLYRHLFRDK